MARDGYRANSALLAEIGNIEPKFAKIDLAADGEIVAAVPGYKIKILGGMIVGAATVSLKSDTTALTGAMVFPAGSTVLPVNFPSWYAEGVADKNINLATGAQVSGFLVYFLDPVEK